ncbi:PVC-type heme-binding CxxCH protein [Anatilimnocola sp. NA78]|uniref:PVC-type heme-binding CxxCH protein n=1 Tax=Anatilimnocola sp. NA78 TaxID=3415683 RepID=UPI003CE58AB6
MKHLSWFIVLSLIIFLARASSAADPFAEGVRTTPWLSPEDEQKAFKLPDGFAINLVAAEPDIQKPLNMQFDERGRIWLTCSVEYPYAAPNDRPAKDSIRVLEDTDGDGRFEKMTIFADGLNIPMGIYPWKGGCIAFSIPDIIHFEDTDGDGTCDKRTKLYGPFDTTRDTHGMCNAFRRGFDGWLYACHGFNNQSKVKGTDGNEVTMHSGNTFRFKLDGSRIEHFTHGQVNPFGMCFDERFNIFTADCHSKPIYQLLRGGYYPSFGKPHDGLGFVPPMMDHLHGSTAICGLTTYTGDNFPEKYRGLFFSGNVMTSRINCNAAEYQGSTIKAIEQPDFLGTTDPWFRPVDIHIGPDGAMYVLDFYNRIIGHYEVPLPHPGRDRTSGRIWRIAYTGNDPKTKPAKMPRDLKGLSTKELLVELENPNLQRRLTVQHYLTDVVGVGDFAIVDYMSGERKDSLGLCHAIWAITLTPDASIELPAERSTSEVLKIHYAKAKANQEEIGANANTTLVKLASSVQPPFVRRAAAEALGVHPNSDSIRGLLGALAETAKDDTHLTYTIRLALRNQLAAADSLERLDALELTAAESAELASICLAVNSPAAATILLRQIEGGNVSGDQLSQYIQHAAKNASGSVADRIAPVAKKQLANNLPQQARMVMAIQAGLATRNEQPGKALIDWAKELSTQLLASAPGEVLPWRAVAVEGLPASEQPWVIQERVSKDGDKESKFFCSLPSGETLTGIYRSEVFAVPEQLTFWCAGHDGVPPGKPSGNNKIVLRDVETKGIIKTGKPPRNDVAQKIEWDLKPFVGRQAYLELIDADTGTGYAWFAVGRFSLNALNPVPQVTQQTAGCELATKFKLADLRPRLGELLAGEKTDAAVRAAAGQAFVALETQAANRALATALGSSELAGVDRTRLLHDLTSGEEARVAEALKLALRASPLRLQTLIADTLTSDKAGAEVLFALVKAGQASPRLLTLPTITARLPALGVPKWKEQIAELTAGLPTDAEARDKLIAERRTALEKNTADGTRGAELFAKNCANCHQIAGKGAIVGPQLDGIGLRGRDRILEDVLDPNRNVDVAFRTTTLQLADGRVVSGLFRREEGALLVLVDPLGKEFTVPKNEIEERKQTSLSLMPANVGETINPTDFADLATFLLAQKKPQEK